MKTIRKYIKLLDFKSFLKNNRLIILLLLLGVIYKVLVTSNGNFLFHIDTARDYVDVRSIVELGKLRLIGQTSAIEGVFNGPGWYYFLAIPYILSGGNPYSGVLLMILCWAIGGYFIYKLTHKYGPVIWFLSLLVWFGSPYIGLTTVYSFNPNPTLLLYPLFIFLLNRYLQKGDLSSSLMLAFLSGLFFNFEMYPSFFLPFIVIASMLLTKNYKLFSKKEFWISSLFYALFFVPQIIFDLKHDFLMSKALMKYLNSSPELNSTLSFNIFMNTWHSLKGGLNATFLNNNIVYNTFAWSFPVYCLILFRNKFLRTSVKKEKSLNKIDNIMIISLLTIVISFIGFSLISANMNPWHLGPILASSVVIFSSSLSKINENIRLGKVFNVAVLGFVFILVSTGTIKGLKNVGQESPDPSVFANEIKAIDYAYKQAQGQNFRVYVYLPSVIDYPYQYLFWWYGMKKYGYTPIDYAYLPNVPTYITNKEAFIKPKQNTSDSGLIILIKEPDRIGYRSAWEGELKRYSKILDKQEMGSLIVETRVE